MDSHWLTQAWAQDGQGPFPLEGSDLLPGLQAVAPALTHSTNQLLWELWHQGYPAPLTAIAREQTAGRGQWGRRWQSQRGGLYLSLLLTLDLPASAGPHLVLLSAWGIASALAHHGIPVQLKWPNDLLLGGKKLGGIKTETKISQGRIRAGVIGLGINWANPVPPPGTSLQTYCEQEGIGSISDLTSLAEISLAGLTIAWQRYQWGGIDSILTGYLKFFAHQGQTLAWQGESAQIKSVTSQGELLVTVGGQAKTIAPGAVSLGYKQEIN